MNVNFSGSPDVFNSFSYSMTDLDGGISFAYIMTDINKKIPVTGNNQRLFKAAYSNAGTLSKSKRRTVIIAALLIFLITFCYRVPSPVLQYHKEGVIHDNIFENLAFKHSKNDGMILFFLPPSSSWDPLLFKAKTYKLIFVRKLALNKLWYSYLSTHKSRDDLLK